jgi:hypothetical protein
MIIHKIRGDIYILGKEIKKLINFDIKGMVDTDHENPTCGSCYLQHHKLVIFCSNCGNKMLKDDHPIYLYPEYSPHKFIEFLEKVAKYTLGVGQYVIVHSDSEYLEGVIVENGNVSYHKVNIELVK